MLFNSIVYIFAFLPTALALYHLVGLTRLHPLRRVLLIGLTLVFYGFGSWKLIPLLLGSVALNYAAAMVLSRLEAKPTLQRLWLSAAIAGNIGALFYFKYFNFVLVSLNDAFDTRFIIERIVLPLGISFFTFQQIAFLVDLLRKRFKLGGLLDYASWVLFFPQILAGPIVLYGETAPQLRENPARGTVGRNILIGLVIFSIGLFKKTVVADTLALYASPVFEASRAGVPIGFLDTWLAAFAYTAQIYFDFSGYSDMAIGTARMFGVTLPLNFHSPLRSASVVEIWRRWHITLGRFVQNYIFQPIAVPMTRFAMGRDFGRWRLLAAAVIIPTMISMLVVGAWHGAGWPFLVFGLMQGLYMSANEIWSELRRKSRRQAPPVWADTLARAGTLAAFTLSIIPFGSPTVEAMWRMFSAMTGHGGVLTLPEAWPLGLSGALVVVAVAYVAIYVAPNTQYIMAQFDPVLEWKKWRKSAASPMRLEWRMTSAHAALAALIFFLGVAFIMRGSAKFIYFNF